MEITITRDVFESLLELARDRQEETWQAPESDLWRTGYNSGFISALERILSLADSL